MDGIIVIPDRRTAPGGAARRGPLLILAGPGRGKTRVVTHRVAYLLAQGIPDQQIVALTFTNKAADEMRSRLDRLAPGNRVWMGTFHRFCSRLLRQYAPLVGLRENFSIYDTDDSQKLLREAIDDAEVELIHETPARIAAAISWAKNDLITADSYHAAVRQSPGFDRGPGLSRLSAPVADGERRGFRRPADARGHAAAGERDLAGNAGPAISLHPGRRVPGHEPGPVRHRPGPVDRPPEPGRRPAIPTSRSTAGAARPFGTSWNSSGTFRTCRSCGWSRTTAARSAFSARPIS